MSIKKDNISVTAVKYNNQDVNKVILNNNCVWCRPFTYTQGALPTGVKFVYILLSSKGVIKKTYTPTLQPCENVWYIIIMSPFLGFNGAGTTLNVTESYVKNGLYPTETLYPSESLYPYFGVWDKLKGGE